MKTTIITENINSIQSIELTNYMQNCIKESMNSIDSHDAAGLMWYQDCEMDEYFTEWQQIWNDDEYVGEGLDTIAHMFILNDDTRIDFESCFTQARDAAFEEKMRDINDEINNFFNEFDGFEVVEKPEDWDEEEQWDGEAKGKERIGSDTSSETCFYEDGVESLYYAIYNADPNNFSTDAFAAFFGATAKYQWEQNDPCDWTAIYYKSKTLTCDIDLIELFAQAEGGMDGWFRPIFASIDEEHGCIDLTLGDQVSNGTSFYDGNIHSTSAAWVGSIETWKAVWHEGDEKAWAKECHTNPEDFDFEDSKREEVKNRMFDNEDFFNELEKSIKANVIEFAKSKGYKVEF